MSSRSFAPRRRTLSSGFRPFARGARLRSFGPRVEKLESRFLLAATAVDRIAADRTRVVAETAGYGGSDLVCYRAEAPAELSRRQAELWQPLIAWVAERYDVALNVTTGIVAVPQPAHALERFRRLLEAGDLYALTAMAVLTAAAGSLVIALATAEGRLTAEQAAEAALLDELFQQEKWGSDPEAEARRAAVRRDLADGLRFLRLSRL